MNLLVMSNVVEVVVVVGSIAGISEILSREILESVFVEDILEMLEGQGELKDCGVNVSRLPLLNRVSWMGGSKASQHSASCGGGKLHVEDNEFVLGVSVASE